MLLPWLHTLALGWSASERIGLGYAPGPDLLGARCHPVCHAVSAETRDVAPVISAQATCVQMAASRLKTTSLSL